VPTRSAKHCRTTEVKGVFRIYYIRINCFVAANLIRPNPRLNNERRAGAPIRDPENHPPRLMKKK
jgi:hypothetical protein